jgi:hypothetical protein
MDERVIKRLLVILAASIVAIFIFKAMMTNTITKLNKAADEKQQAAAKPAVVQMETNSVPDVAPVDDLSPVSSVMDAPMLETQSASGASGAQ